LTLNFIVYNLSNKAGSDLLKENIHSSLSSNELRSGSTQLNVFLRDEVTNLVKGADLFELNLLYKNEPMKVLLEIDENLLGWCWELLDDRLNFFDVVRLSQISDTSLLTNEKDSCFLLYAILGLTVLFK
jgi:hypothetical protein